MTKSMPPIPPAARSNKGPAAETPQDHRRDGSQPQASRNLAEQGHQRNIRQNTMNQGYQQDR